MLKLLKKELRLTASPLSYWFIGFSLLTFCPGYPILVGGFFVCLGILQSFRSAREVNDILYSALLPVPKTDVVRGKYLFCGLIQLGAFLVSAVVVLLRMTVFRDAAIYRSNALMNANLTFLGFLLLLFGCFNAVFVRGFFKTSFPLTGPFIRFAILAFLIVAAGEALHFLPGLAAVNAFGFEQLGLQLVVLASGAALYGLLTVASVRGAAKQFEKINL